VGGQRHATAALNPRKTRNPLYRRLAGPQGRSGRVRKISSPPEFDSPTVQQFYYFCLFYFISSVYLLLDILKVQRVYMYHF